MATQVEEALDGGGRGPRDNTEGKRKRGYTSRGGTRGAMPETNTEEERNGGYKNKVGGGIGRRGPRRYGSRSQKSREKRGEERSGGQKRRRAERDNYP